MCSTTKKNYSVQATSTPTHLTPLNDTPPIPYVKLYTTTKLTPTGKEYLRFQVNNKSSQADKCVKSKIMNKVTNYILSIDTFEQQCVVLKGMLQFPRIKYHMKTISIDQLLSNEVSFEHKCLNNIKKIYQHAGMCDDQKHLKIFLRLLWFILHKK